MKNKRRYKIVCIHVKKQRDFGIFANAFHSVLELKFASIIKFRKQHNKIKIN